MQLHLVQVYVERVPADFEAANVFREEFENTITQEKLSPDQVYNTDETILF